MRIAISGSSGLIGSALIKKLESRGDEVTRLRHGRDYDVRAGTLNREKIDGQDAIVHLAGESIAGLWTSSKKRAIRESREKGTALLATSLAELRHPPRTFVCASAIGYYGDRGNEPVDEGAGRGQGFLADVTEAWEAAADRASTVSRVVKLRFGIVLSANGGALAPILPVFKLGLGGKFGSGRQVWSWVALDDVVGSICFAIDREELRGVVNVVAPQPVTNLAFTRTLGRVLRRPTVFGVPETLLKLGGDMPEEMLLFGARVVPRKLQEAGYPFAYPELEAALRHELAHG